MGQRSFFWSSVNSVVQKPFQLEITTLSASQSVTTFNSTFAFCTSLQSTGITTDIFRYNTNVTTFGSVFQNCTSLTAITNSIFDYNTGVTSFLGAFYNCTALTSIPSTLFNNCTGVTNFNQTFDNCTALTGNAPTLWLRTSPTPTGLYCFRGDTNLLNYAAAQTAGWT